MYQAGLLEASSLEGARGDVFAAERRLTLMPGQPTMDPHSKPHFHPLAVLFTFIQTRSRSTVLALAGLVLICASTGCKDSAGPASEGPEPVATVRGTPATTERLVGQTIQLTATALDANGNTLSGRTISWSSATSRWRLLTQLASLPL